VAVVPAAARVARRLRVPLPPAHEALRQQQEALRQQQEALRQQQEALRQQQEALRQQQEALRQQRLLRVARLRRPGVAVVVADAAAVRHCR
jgi:hypothetical protein